MTLGGSATGGTLDLAGNIQTVAGLIAAANATAAVVTSSTGSATLTYSNSGGSSLFPGTIQDTALTSGGTLGLTVSGGTLDVSGGSLLYYGATTVNGGQLLLAALPNSTGLFVGPSGTATFPGSGITAPALSNSGNIAFTATSGTVTLTTLSGPGTTTFGWALSSPAFRPDR